MADEEVGSTGAEAGAGGSTSEQQAPESTSQEAAEGQSSGQGQVESTSTAASSGGKSGRSNNSYWANQRIIEKSVRAALAEQLSPFLDEFKRGQSPQAPAPQKPNEQPDWNDLPGWLQGYLPKIIQEHLSKSLPQQLNQFGGQLERQLSGKSRMQEARNYLISQKDIGRDNDKLAEIRKVMEDNFLEYALEHDPIAVTEKAVDIWRKMKVNPNAPPKGHLTGVTGGAGTQPKTEASIDDLRALQNKLAAGGLTMEDQAKLDSQIDSLVFGGARR